MTAEIAGTLVGLVGIAAAFYLGRAPQIQARHQPAVANFRRVHGWIRSNDLALNQAAASEHANIVNEDIDFKMIAKPGWILPEPIPLDRIEISLDEHSPEPPDHKSITQKFWPRDEAGKIIDGYHQAISAYARPDQWFDSVSYRVVDIEAFPEQDRLSLNLGLTTYWKGYDASETLTYEAAMTYLNSNGRRISGKYRRELKDPFDFSARTCPICVSVLTVRNDPSGATFYLHRRDERVATSANQISVIPAGEFQPSDDSRHAAVKDCDLWSLTMREYAEEFLGIEEARFRPGVSIDFLRESPYPEIQSAYREGLIKVFSFGVYMYPSSWKLEISLVAVWNPEAFDSILGTMRQDTSEGFLQIPSIVREEGRPFEGWPFESAEIDKWSKDPLVGYGTQAILKSAWRHRESLGIATPPTHTSRSTSA